MKFVRALVVALIVLAPAWVGAETFSVNSLGDDPDISADDGVCEADIEGGGVCTLRAAIEQANASMGPDTLVFDALADTQDPSVVLTRPLPVLGAGIVVDGRTHPDGVSLVGSNLGEDGPGLRLAGEALLAGLRVKFFGGSGIVAAGPLTLVEVEISENCGWGVEVEGDLIIGREGAQTLDQESRIATNGTRRRCPAGGIKVGGRLEASHIEIQANGGPGIYGFGDMDLFGVVSLANAGPGLQAQGGSVVIRAESRRGADNRFQSNQGAGIVVESTCGEDPCDVLDMAGVEITDNGGWGVEVNGSVRIGAREGEVIAGSTVSRNGRGEACAVWRLEGEQAVGEEVECVGGGVLSSLGQVRGGLFVADANAGPGVMAAAGVDLTDATVQANEADGIVTDADALFSGKETLISGNEGRGVVVGGRAEVEGIIQIVDNSGWGLFVEGEVLLRRSEDVGRRDSNDISRNGLGDYCVAWRFEAGAAVGREVECLGGGVLSVKGVATVDNLALKANGGPGVLARGDIVFSALFVSGNEGEGLNSVEGFVAGGDADVAENFGRGIVAGGEEGGIGVRVAGVIVRDNFEVGIYAEASIVLGGDGEADSVSVDRNGDGDFCQRWSLDLGPVVEEVECESGGVLSQSGFVRASALRVSSNPGHGIEALGALVVDDESGASVFLKEAQVVGNEGVGVVAVGPVRVESGSFCENEGGPFEAPEVSLKEVEVCGDTDGDGVPNNTEEGASESGDLNGDGVRDSLQPNVAAFPIDGDEVLVVEVEEGLRLFEVGLGDDPGGFPEGIVRVLAAHTLGVEGIEPGASVQVRVTMPEGTAPSGYFARSKAAEVWAAIESAEIEGDGAVLDFEEGGDFDLDESGTLTLIIAPTRTLAEELEAEDPDGDEEVDEGSVTGALCGCQTPAAPSAPLGWPMVLLGLAGLVFSRRLSWLRPEGRDRGWTL